MKTKIKNHLKQHRIKYILGLVFMLFIGGVSFKKILDRHTRKRKEAVEYIIVHYTANLHPNASAEMNAKYLQRKRQAGCHYAVDDTETIQCVPEEMVAYAVGDRKWLGFVPKPWLKGKIFNENSISYEMCLGGGRNDSLIVETTAKYVAWQLFDKRLYHGDTVTVNGARFIKKIPDLGRVVRHHDVSGKQCPKFYYDKPWNQEREDRAFYIFKLKVEKYFRTSVSKYDRQI
jgi:N-acetylmuramoyl-L-alanine amidase CwlA